MRGTCDLAASKNSTGSLPTTLAKCWRPAGTSSMSPGSSTTCTSVKANAKQCCQLRRKRELWACHMQCHTRVQCSCTCHEVMPVCSLLSQLVTCGTSAARLAIPCCKAVMQHTAISQYMQGDGYLPSPAGLGLMSQRDLIMCYKNPSPQILIAKLHLIVLRLEQELPANDRVLLAAAMTVPAEGGACTHTTSSVLHCRHQDWSMRPCVSCTCTP